MYNIGRETEQIEYKRSTGELKEGVISIASILNKHGSGELYFGVKNNGDVIGQVVSDKTLREISQAISQHIKPAIYPIVEEKIYDDKKVAYVKFEGKRAPYLAYNIPRIRVADEDKVMDQETCHQMMLARDNQTDSWETQLSKYHIDDVDREVFEGYLRKARQVGRISLESDDLKYVMTKLELCDDDVLLNAGAALFVNCGINELQMARFASDERLTFNDIKRYTGSILELADKAIVYVADAMDWRVVIDGSPERKEIPEVPTDAIREAVINAFGHRIIESAQSVEVAVYKSFIEIYSPGSFPENVTPEQFIKEIRKPIRRNPLITRTLYYSKDMESFATGLKRINDACNKAGVRVEFYGDTYGFTVRFYRHCGEGWGDVKVPKAQNDTLDDTLDDTLENKIIELLNSDSHMTQQLLAEKTKVSLISIKRIMKKMSDSGKIVRKGGKRYGYWVVRNK